MFGVAELPYEEAATLIAESGDVGALARHIVSQMLACPETEGHWRQLAGACVELLEATAH
jgi:hypothetical protein